jgi:hypothetical protein
MRLVVTKRNSATAAAGATDGTAPATACDSYRERLVKYVPVEVLVLYVAAYGVLYATAGNAPWFSAAASCLLIAGIIAVLLYLWRAEGVCDTIQLAISAIGFVLFASALGVAPVSALPLYNQVFFSLLLPVYVFLSPLFDGMPDRW